jgi:hypothetical protein
MGTTRIATRSAKTDANSHVVTMVYDDGAKAIGEWGNGKIVGKAPVPPL